MITVQQIESHCVLVDFVLATITAMITDTSFLNKYTTGTFNKGFFKTKTLFQTMDSTICTKGSNQHT